MTAEEGRRGRLDRFRIEKLKKQIGEQLGVNVRTVNRYLAILDSPPAVQQAYDRGEISQVEAAKIGSLCSFYCTITKEQQEEINHRITAGETAREVIKEFVPSSNGRHKKDHGCPPRRNETLGGICGGYGGAIRRDTSNETEATPTLVRPSSAIDGEPQKSAKKRTPTPRR